LGCRPIREVNHFFSGDSNVFSIKFIGCHWKVCTKIRDPIFLKPKTGTLNKILVGGGGGRKNENQTLKK
jgi:hypothetical protein